MPAGEPADIFHTGSGRGFFKILMAVEAEARLANDAALKASMLGVAIGAAQRRELVADRGERDAMRRMSADIGVARETGRIGDTGERTLMTGRAIRREKPVRI